MGSPLLRLSTNMFISIVGGGDWGLCKFWVIGKGMGTTKAEG